jgi:metal-responsive CopG/Arc/MetJ family transcriptional regulator
MPTEKPKILFIAEDNLIEREDDYRYDKRIPTRSEAIRRLLDEALKKYERSPQNNL